MQSKPDSEQRRLGILAAKQNQVGQFVDDEEQERFVGVELWRRYFISENACCDSGSNCSLFVNGNLCLVNHR